MQNIVEFFKRIPADLRQAFYSLAVSALLITGALFMLGGYLESMESEPSREAVATATDEAESESESE